MTNFAFSHQKRTIKKQKQQSFTDKLPVQPRGLDKLLERARKKPLKEYNDFIEASVDARIASHKSGTSTRRDMFHFLLTAVDPETNLPAFADRNRLLSEARLLVLAGTDTTGLGRT